MDYKICPICSNAAPYLLTKKSTPYNQCSSCKTVFSDPLENSGMVGGGAEKERNELQNPERIKRIDSLFRTKNIKVLDFGSGNNLFVNDLIAEGYDAVGYDAYNPLYSKLPEKGVFDIVTAVECAEHFSKPYIEFDCIQRSLKPGGIFYVETSFTDVAMEEGISFPDFSYLEPSVGHSTLFSHHSLDLILALRGFHPIQHFNRHVRCFQKK